MKLDPSRHHDHTWRVHTLAADFTLLDVWELPITREHDDTRSFADLLELAGDQGLEAGNKPTQLLFELRRILGHVFGWERADVRRPIPGCSEAWVSDRLAPEDTAKNQAANFGTKKLSVADVHPVYIFEDEALLELSNATIHALIHFCWRTEKPQLAIYIKSRGWFSDAYMALIAPFRHWIVYPAYTRHLGEKWATRAHSNK